MSLEAFHQLGQTVGARLRAARQAKKYTQSQLAHPEFSVSYISAIERGQIQPSLRALEILTKRLGISPTDVLPQQKQAVVELSSPPDKKSVQEGTRDLSILEARLAFCQGTPEQVIDLLRTLLVDEKRRNTLLYILLGQAYLQSGYIQESEQALSEATALLQETPDYLVARLLSLQSLVYMAAHNTNRALTLQHESLAMLERATHSDVFLLARLYNNLGQQYSHLEQWKQAEETFNQAQALLENHTTYKQVEQTYWDLLLTHKEREEWSEAAYNGYKCLLAEAQASWPLLKSEIQHALNRALLMSSPEEAYDYLLAETQKADQQHNALGQASAHVYLASWFAERKQLDKAEFHARAALKLADSSAPTTILADAYVLLGELAYQRQDYLEGDQAFEQGLNMLKRLGRDQDLIEHLTAYANLLEGRNQISRAIVYWKQAYEYRQRNREDPL